MESLSQRLVRDLFESHHQAAAEAVASAEKNMLKAKVDLATAIGELESASQSSAPFISDLNRVPLNLALHHLRDASACLDHYTAKSQPVPEPQPVIES